MIVPRLSTVTTPDVYLSHFYMNEAGVKVL